MSSRPTVLIVGAGLGGLSLAIILERADIPYKIFERSPAIKPLGSALSLGANIIPFFKQIGIYDEFIQEAAVRYTTQVYGENCGLDFMFDSRPAAEMGGHDGYIISRPAIYDILCKRIPAHKIYLSKRVLKAKQDEKEVVITCADGSFYYGHIIVGADGTYSGVRQSIYREMKLQGRLPKGDDDQQRLPYNCTCLVGQTRPLDSKEFPELDMPESSFDCVLSSDKPYTWITFTTKSNTICWMVVHHLDKISFKTNDSFRNSEWGHEAAASMCNDVRDLPIPSGGRGISRTLGTLMEHTDMNLISKVTLEEKIFETWFDGRIVLLGDACHKMNPAGGQGALNAMQDAITLANWINVLKSNDVNDIKRIFQEYKNERYPHVMDAFGSSRMFSRIIAKDLSGKVARFMFKNMPRWLWLMSLRKLVSNRPQVAFLPLVEDTGAVKPVQQQSLQKTRPFVWSDGDLILVEEDPL